MDFLCPGGNALLLFRGRVQRQWNENVRQMVAAGCRGAALGQKRSTSASDTAMRSITSFWRNWVMRISSRMSLRKSSKLPPSATIAWRI